LNYDVIVLGLGAMGSAVTYQLAKRGARVLGIDRYAPPHDLGSSHGATRITRQAIGEGEGYTPLAARSHELWREMESLTGASLMTVTGGLIISSTGKTAVNHVPHLFENTLAAASTHGITHQLLTGAAIRREFPPFKVEDDEMGYYEPGAGFLRPERCVGAQLRLARARRAELRLNLKVLGFSAERRGVTVYTKDERLRAGRLVLCAGAWLPPLLGARYAKLFSVRRQSLHWFALEDTKPYRPGAFPVFMWELKGDRQMLYGFPAIDGPEGGLKLATEQIEEETAAETVDRVVDKTVSQRFYKRQVKPSLKNVSGKCLRAESCLYTVTPDSGFIIDAHPEHPAVTVVSACSGHGFKHSAAIGEAVAETVVDGKSRIDLSPFRFDRFKDLLSL